MSWTHTVTTTTKIAPKKKATDVDLTPFGEAVVKVAERLKMHPRVVAVLLDTAVRSDHDGIQKQIEDLLVITKMTHPEPAFRESKAIEAEEREALAEMEREKRRHAVQRKALEEHRRKEEELDRAAENIRKQNLNNAQKAVDDLKAKIVGGLNFDKLTYQEQSLAGEISHMPGNYVERGGFLWHKITWIGEDIVLHENHHLYGWLKKHRFDLFTDEPKRVSQGFYTGYQLGDYLHLFDLDE